MNTTIICLENIGIGGVETSVLNQAMEYKRRKENVVILARKGIYSKFLEENGITFENFEFPIEDNFNIEKITEFCEIIKKYNAKEVIINQFPCMMVASPACIIENIPYVIYLHTATKTIKDDEFNVFNWFENQYDIYKIAFKTFFQNSKKIIAISKVAAEYLKERYSLDENKFVIIPNSINLDIYKSTRLNENGKGKFVIISRINNEKIRSIKNGIDIFKKYNNSNKTLDIIGDGDRIDEIKDYIGTDEKIKLLGAKNNISKLLENYDIVLGLDRTILEALAMKKIAVVIGYENPKGIITIDNIDIAAKNGFSGEGLKDKKIEEIALELDKNKIDKDKNYEYVKNNLNIMKNIYIENDYNTNYNFLDIFEIIKEIKDQDQEVVSKSEGLIQENSRINEKNQQLSEELEKVKKELNSVYNSKRFKFVNNVANLLKPNQAVKKQK